MNGRLGWNDIHEGVINDGFRLTLQCTDLSGNSNKVWKVEWNNGLMTTYWGRVGATLQSSSKRASPYGVVKKIRSKRKKGYEIVTEGTAQEVEVDAPEPVKKFLRWATMSANNDIASYYTGDVGGLSPAQIQAGQRQIDLVASLTQRPNYDLHRVIEEVERYYTLIPTRLPHRIVPEQVARHFVKSLGEQQERLRQLSAAQQGLAAKQANQVSVEDLFGCGVTETEEERRERIIREVLGTSRGKISRGDILEVVSLESPERRKRYESLPLENEEPMLFHGTKTPYVRHIVRQGLLLSKAGTTGTLFGKGLYFGNESSKALSYAKGSEVRMIFVSRVNRGQSFEPDSELGQGDVERILRQGYSSVWAKQRRSISGVYNGFLAHDEIIVYDEARHDLTDVVVLAS